MNGRVEIAEQSSLENREELINKCYDMGIPITGDEDSQTLELYLGPASEDDYDDDFDDDDDFADDDLEDDVDDLDDGKVEEEEEGFYEEDFDFDDEDDIEEDDDFIDEALP